MVHILFNKIPNAIYEIAMKLKLMRILPANSVTHLMVIGQSVCAMH